MKKLLSILAALGLTATAATTVVACSTSTKSITTDKNGYGHFSTKITLSRFSYLNKDKDGNYEVIDPEFALMPTADVKGGAQDGTPIVNAVDIIKMTINKKYLEGIFEGTQPGPTQKEIKVLADFQFKMTPEVDSKSYDLTLIQTNTSRTTIDHKIEKIEVSVPGTGAHPAFLSASYDGNKTITVSAKDLDKLKGGFKQENLKYTPELPVDKVEEEATSLKISLTSPLKKYKTNKTYEIEYKDENVDLKASVNTSASTLNNNATLSKGGKTITISGTNLGTISDAKKDLTVDPTLDIDSVSVTDSQLTINLTSPIERDFDDHTWVFTYKLDSGDELTSNLAVAKKGKPVFSSATYDRAKKTITISGTDFDNFPEGKVDPNKFTIDGSESKVSEASINGGSITAVLDKPIEEHSADKSYAISYKDAGADNLDIKGTSFNVEATTLDSSATYNDNTTITIKGKNLDNLGDVTNSVSIDGAGATLKSANVTADTLVVELTAKIDWTYEAQNFKVNYKLTGGDTVTSSFSVSPKTMPTFKSADYNRDAKTITISGTDFENFKDFDAKKLALEDKSGAKITDAKIDGNKITATLDKEIVETMKQGSYSIKYTDAKWKLDLSTAVNVTATTLITKAGYDAKTKTITISGTNLGKHSDVKSSVEVTVEGGAKLEVASASTTDSALTVALSKDIDPSYSNQTVDVVYTLNSGDKFDPAKFDVAGTKVPTFGTSTYDGDKTITIDTTDIKNMIGGFVQSNLKIKNDTAKEDIAYASAVVDGESIKVTLNDRLKDYASEQNYSISYGDDKLPAPLTSSFNTKGLSVDKTNYDDTTGTITITGKNFGIDRGVKDQIKIDGQVNGKDLVIASANITGGSLVIKLDKHIGQVAENKTFNITWSLTGGDKLTGKFDIKGSNFTGEAKYDNHVDIKIDGSNLGTTTVPEGKVSVTGADGKDQIKVKSAETKESKAKKFFSIFAGSSSDSYMDITLDSAIAKSYDPTRSFNIAYTLSSGEIINSSFTMDGIAKPSFGQFDYDQDSKTITVHGDNLTQDFFLGYQQQNWSVEGQKVDSVQFVDNKNLKIVLAEPIKKFTTDKSYAVAYKDSSNGLDVNGTLTVKKTTLETKASYNENGTITVSGTNLGNNADVSKAISGLDSSIKVNKASTTDNTLTLEVSPITKKFKDQEFTFNYGLSGGETISGIKFTVNGDKALAPTLSAATYDAAKKEVTVTGTNFGQISWGGTFSIVDSTVTATKKSQNDNSIVLGLSDVIAEQDTKKTYQVKYTDSDLPDGITTTSGFDVKAKSKFTSAELQSDNQTIKVTGQNFLTTDTTKAKVNETEAATTVVSDTEIDVKLASPVVAVYWEATKLSLDITNDGVNYKKDLSVAANEAIEPSFGTASWTADYTTIKLEGTNFQDSKVNWAAGSFKGLPDKASVTNVTVKSNTEMELTVSGIALQDAVQEFNISYDDGHSTSLVSTNKLSVEAKATLGTAKLENANTITVAGTNLTNKDIKLDSVTVNKVAAKATATASELTITVSTSIKAEYWEEQSFAISLDGGLSGTLTSTLKVNKDDKVPAFSSAAISNDNKTITITGTNISQLGTIDKSKFSIDKGTLDIKDVSSTDTNITINLNTELSAETFTIKYDDGHKTDLSTSLTVNALYELKSAHYDEAKTITVEIANLENVSDKSIFSKGWSITAPDKKEYKVASATISGNNAKLTLQDPIDTKTVANTTNGGKAALLNNKITVNFTDPNSQKVQSVDDTFANDGWVSSVDYKAVYKPWDGKKATLTITGKNVALIDWSNKKGWKFSDFPQGLDKTYNSPSANVMSANVFSQIDVIDNNTVKIEINTDVSGSLTENFYSYGLWYSPDGNPDDGTYRMAYNNPNTNPDADKDYSGSADTNIPSYMQ